MSDEAVTEDQRGLRVSAAEFADTLRQVITASVTTDADLTAAHVLLEQSLRALGPVVSVADHRARTESGARRTVNPFDSPENPLAPPMRAIHEAPGEYVAELTLTPAYEGPPGRVHGGVVTGILDHASGFALPSLGVVAMSVSLSIDLHAATPYGEPLTVSARVVERDGRKIWVETGLRTADGTLTASARTLMLELVDPPAWVAAMYPGKYSAS
jgi:acyl-coenzyme A thioesterase PaaI-like protein